MLLALDSAGAFSLTAPGLVRAVRVVPSAAQVMNRDTLHWPRLLDCVCACAHSVHAFVHACMHACMHACVRACVCACVRACVRACMHACVHVCVHA